MINPPTDNLYKFCSIVGLFLLIFNSYYSFELLNDSSNELTKLIGEQNKIYLKKEINNQNLEESYKELKTLLDKRELFLKEKEPEITLANQNGLRKKELDALILEFEHEEEVYKYNSGRIISTRKIIEKERNAIKYEEIEIETKYNLIKIQNKRIDNYLIFMKIGFFLGPIISLYGFYNWIKIQKLIDKQLINK